MLKRNMYNTNDLNVFMDGQYLIEKRVTGNESITCV